MLNVTAFQVCAESGFNEILPTARTIACDTNQQSILRLSAIAAIGQIGTPEDVAVLKSIHTDPFLQKSLEPALKKLEQRKFAPVVN